MKPWLMAIIGRQRQLVTETFTRNSVWVAPSTTNKLETLSGKGGAGAPGRIYYDVTETVSVDYDSPEYGQDNTAERTDRIYEPSNPTSGCLPPVYYPAEHATVQYCYTFTTGQESGTTGPSATGFGSTFPGGAGGPATTTTIASPPAVLPRASYTLVIPADGSITFSYYK